MSCSLLRPAVPPSCGVCPDGGTSTLEAAAAADASAEGFGVPLGAPRPCRGGGLLSWDSSLQALRACEAATLLCCYSTQ
jgi:hypothetical protein